MLVWILPEDWREFDSVPISLMTRVIMDQSAGSLLLFGAFCVPIKDHELTALKC